MATVSLTITRDDIRPAFNRLVKMGRDTTPVMRSMGTTFMSITIGNFNSAGASYRPVPWVPKKDGSPSNLQKSGLLWHSFHLVVTSTSATLANPTPYASVHQFGSGAVDRKRQADSAKRNVTAKTMNIPARPFYPVQDGKLTATADVQISAAGMRAVERIAGGK